jgi:hypothetical protein
MDVCRSLAMAGKPGRYMSIEKGAMADKNPSIKIMVVLFFEFMLMVLCWLLCKNRMFEEEDNV